MKLLIKATDCGEVAYFNEKWKSHREDGPAVTYSNGTTFGYFNGNLHRSGGPAVEGGHHNHRSYYNHGEIFYPIIKTCK